LVHTERGKLRQLSIPKTLVALVREACERHREIRRLTAKLSQIAWRQLETAKGQPEAKGRAANRRKVGLTTEGGRPYNEGVV
jgi:hypothetical protein